MLDKNAQSLPGGIRFAGDESLKLFDGAVRNGDHECFTLSEGMIEVKRRPVPPPNPGLPCRRSGRSAK
jgi:hypothetical protein